MTNPEQTANTEKIPNMNKLKIKEHTKENLLRCAEANSCLLFKRHREHRAIQEINKDANL